MGNEKSRPCVRVTVYKEFEYPKSMLHKNLFIDDAHRKAFTDMQTLLNEMVKNDFADIDVNIFKFDVKEEPGYKFRKNIEEEKGSINISKAAKILTNQRMEAKHGALNHEENPGIYIMEPEMRSPRGELLREAIWYFRAEIEQEYYQIHDEIYTALRAAR